MDTVQPLVNAGRTRKELRRMVGTRLGDLKVLRASADSASPTVFTDSINLNHSSDYYAGRIAYFCGGQAALIGVQANVASSSAATRTLTFSETLPVAPLAGDEVHLINWSGVGFTPDEYHNTMNDVIVSITDSHYFVPVAIDVSLSYDADTNTIQLPTSLRIIESVDYSLPTPYNDGQWQSDWQHLTKARFGGTDGWYVDRPSGRIVLRPWSRATGYPVPQIRITGYGIPPLMETDTDTCSVPAEWFIEECAARMLEKNIQKNPGIANQDRIYNMLRQHADAIRPINSVRMGPFAERVFY